MSKAIDAVGDIVTKGRVVRGWIGILPEDVSDAQAAQLGLLHGGVVLTQLYRPSPALEAGLRPGDVLRELNGKPIQTAQDALRRIAVLPPGAKLTLVGLRGNDSFEAHMSVIERPRSR